MAMLELEIPPRWKEQWKQIAVHLQEPLKLQVAALSVVTLVGLGVVYRPLANRIENLRKELKSTAERVTTADRFHDVRTLRRALLAQLPENGDMNFWTEYYLRGIRDSGVKLRTLEARPKKAKFGSLQSAELKVEVEGRYESVQSLVAWIEENEWFSRITKLRVAKRPDTLEVQMRVAILVAPLETGDGGN